MYKYYDNPELHSEQAGLSPSGNLEAATVANLGRLGNPLFDCICPRSCPLNSG